ncbi:hypothetical protein nepoznato_147 [Escherichia phage nepoznato]|uniref:Uncharacterized protein n=1 Tax=Escherichia phage nepoznato TaxID=2696431 RepID=A0A6B9WLI6_9CAUD|nr:hypothetical protein JR323_gp130 [Escherichia phage nepoznato]QHR65596.1 hypothetical protein nepoznato_147 [Escherichia phage nepoznato]
MITFAIVAVVAGQVYVNETFTTEDKAAGDITAAYNECKAAERMLSPCLLMSERDDGLTVFSNVENGYQLVVSK